MFYPRVVNGIVVEAVELPDGLRPEDVYHPDIAADFRAPVEDVAAGWVEDGDGYSPPPPQGNDDLAAAARATRDQLLRDCDWTQVSDAPVDKTAWATYRQALREVPEQAGFPSIIDWPVAP